MAAVVKLGAFGAFLHLFTVCFPALHEFWAPALVVLAILTMLVLSETDIKHRDIFCKLDIRDFDKRCNEKFKV
jgi:NADH-quinone oxidoreductase subunit N